MRRDPPSVRRKRQAAIYTEPIEPPLTLRARLVILVIVLLYFGMLTWGTEMRQRECRERGGEWEARPRPGHCSVR